jgi:hypothetical protein
MLAIQKLRNRFRAAPQGGARRHVLHALAVQPDVATVAQSFQVGVASAYSHGFISSYRTPCSGDSIEKSI